VSREKDLEDALIAIRRWDWAERDLLDDLIDAALATPPDVEPKAVGRVPIETIRKAFFAVHDYAVGTSTRPYMSIPADPLRDADLIVCGAIDELEKARAQVRVLREALKASEAAIVLVGRIIAGEKPTRDEADSVFAEYNRAIPAALAATDPERGG
jgi:hypothetical protein